MPESPDQIARLLERTTRLLEDVQNAPDDTPDERTRRRTHELRQAVGALLILTERLARERGNAPMVEMGEGADGTGRVSFTVDLEGTELSPANN